MHSTKWIYNRKELSGIPSDFDSLKRFQQDIKLVANHTLIPDYRKVYRRRSKLLCI